MGSLKKSFEQRSKPMNRKNLFAYIARPVSAVITLLIVVSVLALVQGIVILIVFACTYEKRMPLQRTSDDPNQRIADSEKKFLPDGTVHLVAPAFKYPFSVEEQYTKSLIYDINDNLLWEGIFKDAPYKYLRLEEPSEITFGIENMIELKSYDMEFSRVLEVPVDLSKDTEEVWRYDQSAEVFIGYRLRGNPIGYLGRDGYAENPAQAGPFGKFQRSWCWTEETPLMLWQTDTALFQIDFKKRQVEKLFEIADSKIEYVELHDWKPVVKSDTKRPGLIYCATADSKRYLILGEPKEILKIVIPADWQNSDFTLAATQTNIFLKYSQTNFRPPVSREQSPKKWSQYLSEYSSKPQAQSVQLYKIDKAGQLELVSKYDWIKPANLTKAPPREWKVFYVRKFSPSVYDLAWYLFEDELLKFDTMRDNLMSVCPRIIAFLRPGYSAFNYILSALMVVIALWHGWARRTSSGKLILWLIIVGAFNLAGLLTYLALNHTPVIKCPICGKKRGLERFNCIRCGSPLPVPQRRPTDLILAT
jgi:hypothetical protein